jgi:hypothetical protein
MVSEMNIGSGADATTKIAKETKVSKTYLQNNCQLVYVYLAGFCFLDYNGNKVM